MLILDIRCGLDSNTDTRLVLEVNGMTKCLAAMPTTRLEKYGGIASLLFLSCILK